MAFEKLDKEARRRAVKDAMTPIAMIAMKARRASIDATDEKDEDADETSALGVGTIKNVEQKEADKNRPAHAVVEIRHGKKPEPKKDENGATVPASYDAGPPESRVCVSIESAKNLSIGRRVRIKLEDADGGEENEE